MSERGTVSIQWLVNQACWNASEALHYAEAAGFGDREDPLTILKGLWDLEKHTEDADGVPFEKELEEEDVLWAVFTALAEVAPGELVAFALLLSKQLASKKFSNQTQHLLSLERRLAIVDWSKCEAGRPSEGKA